MAQIITVNGGSGEYKIAAGGLNKGQRTWSVIDDKGVWYTLYWDGEKPKKGQQFNCNVTERDYQGKTYRSAFIVGPTPEQFAQAENIHKLAEGIGNGVKSPPEPTPTAQPGPINGQYVAPPKIKFNDWAQTAAKTWTHGAMTGIPPEQNIGYVQTTLVALRDGKLELPTEAVPVAREPGDDDIPY